MVMIHLSSGHVKLTDVLLISSNVAIEINILGLPIFIIVIPGP